MINWLLDTNVLSETRKRKPNKAVMDWLDSIAIEQVHSSSINIVELEYGAIVCKDEAMRIEIGVWIETDLRRLLGDRIFPINNAILLHWRIISRQREIKQEPGPPVDLLIAAVALINNCSIATRDVAPFVACGIPTLNPWTGERFNGA